jgi:hypothetical protein
MVNKSGYKKPEHYIKKKDHAECAHIQEDVISASCDAARWFSRII